MSFNVDTSLRKQEGRDQEDITVQINGANPSSRTFIRLCGSLCKLFRNAVQSIFNCRAILSKTLRITEGKGKLCDRNSSLSDSLSTSLSRIIESEANTIAVGSG